MSAAFAIEAWEGVRPPSPPPFARRVVVEDTAAVRVGMPHLDLAGLSEAWLFRHAGHAHWSAIHQELGIAAEQLRNDRGERLYASFVAVRARYDVPLARVREDDRLQTSLVMTPCGRSSAHSSITLSLAGRLQSLRLEMGSTFAALVREAGQAGEAGSSPRLRASTPAAGLAATWSSLTETPPLFQWAKDARRGQIVTDPLWARALARTSPPLGRVRLSPSPYGDYNHAGLLYFASFVTLAETAEDRLMNTGEVTPLGPVGVAADAHRSRPWCLRVSPVARDIFYYRNLPLGEALDAELLAVETDRHGVRTHVRLRSAADGETLADVLATKQWT